MDAVCGDYRPTDMNGNLIPYTPICSQNTYCPHCGRPYSLNSYQQYLSPPCTYGVSSGQS